MAIRKIIEMIFKVRGADKAAQQTRKVDSGLKSLATTALKAGAAMFATQGIVKGFRAITEAGKEFAKLEAVRTGFDNLAYASGFSADALQKLKSATDGTISSMELMQQANNAMLLGIFESEDQMAEMFDSAQRLAQALGKDARFGIESLVTGMGRQSKLMLDNVGIMVKVEDAYKKLAKQRNTTVANLSDEQKKQAFVNEAMRQATTLVKDLGEEEYNSLMISQQFTTSTQELQVAIGEFLNPEIVTATENLTKFVNWMAGAIMVLRETKKKFARTALSDDELLALSGGGPEGLRLFRERQKEIAEEWDLRLQREIAYQDLESARLEILKDIRDIEVEMEGDVKDDDSSLDEFLDDLLRSDAAVNELEQGWGDFMNNLSTNRKLLVGTMQQFSSAIVTASIYGQDMGEAVVSSLRAIAAELVSKAATFAILSLLFPGSMQASGVAGKAGFMQFMLQGFSGQTPTVNNNINISGGIVDDSYIRNSFLPAMRRVQSYG